MAVSCESGDRDAAEPLYGDTSTCDLLSDYEDTAGQLDAPEVFSRSSAELASILRDRFDLTRRLAKEAQGELRTGLRRLVRYRRVVDPLLVAAWSERRAELESAGWRWPHEVLKDGVVVEGHSVTYGELGSVARLVHEQLVVRCRAPELGRSPREDRDVPIEDGRIVFNAPDVEGGALWHMQTSGGVPSRLAPPAGWDDLSSPAVAPDGLTVAAVARRFDPPATGIAIGSVARPFEILLEEDPLSISCLAWSPDGRALVATAFDREGASVFRAVDLAGSATRLGLPLRDGSCARYGDTEELVIDIVTPPGGGGGEVVGVSVHDNARRRLYDDEDCNEQVGDISPTHQEISMAMVCSDPTKNGLYIYSEDSGRIRHLLTGNVALPAWSPSGDWIVFGFSPLGQDPLRAVAVWAVRRDGEGLRRLTQPASSFPVWVANAETG